MIGNCPLKIRNKFSIIYMIKNVIFSKFERGQFPKKSFLIYFIKISEHIPVNLIDLKQRLNLIYFAHFLIKYVKKNLVIHFISKFNIYSIKKFLKSISKSYKC